ncbi:hypothetical protein DAI22_03g234900 [Oryza sativa Japonica Group]|nr:hypothetical protein DAI22_03g234900 [Oryza sativa Japonica Group]
MWTERRGRMVLVEERTPSPPRVPLLDSPTPPPGAPIPPPAAPAEPPTVKI